MIKDIIKALLPHGLVEARRKWIAPGLAAPSREEFHAQRQENIQRALAASLEGRPAVDCASHAEMIAFLEGRGIPRHHLVEGSIPAASLAWLGEVLPPLLPQGVPVRGLHLGNFVGVSLAFLTGLLARVNGESLIVAVDPNLPHRGVMNPQAHVAALLCACGLQKQVLMVAGYSSAKSISNDGVVFEGYDPVAAFAGEHACENVLQLLPRLCPAPFDVVLMDGNHEGAYLAREIEQTGALLRPGGLIVLDDVDEAWAEIQAVFAGLAGAGFEIVGTDGRVGVARRVG